MRAMGMQHQLMHTVAAGGTAPAVRKRLLRGDIDVVIYLGGDGTFHEVANGILASGRSVPLGMLPSGTANDQGLSFGIARGHIDRNLSVIAAGHQTALDVGLLQQLRPDGSVAKESYFYDSCGFGIHPDILMTRNRHRLAIERIPLVRDVYRDQAVYVGASIAKLIESYIKPVKFRADIVCDGVPHALDGVTDVIISGTPIYGGAWVLDRDAEPDDGLFELVTIVGRRDWAIKGLRDLAASPVWQRQLDRLGLFPSQALSGRNFELSLYRPAQLDLSAQLDGEEWGTGDKYRVTVLARRLAIITPADFVAPWKRSFR